MSDPVTTTLCMIVRDEEATIGRALNSASPYIDRIDIVDTGSTDRTMDLIREWADNIPVPCMVVERPWTDFATARNQALDLARHGGATFALILDADDVVEAGPPWAIGDTPESVPGFNVAVRHGAMVHFRPQLVRLDQPWRWHGVVHEYLALDSGAPAGPFPIAPLAIVIGEGGHRSRDPRKFLYDADVLAEALKTETDPGLRLRYCFYLAQSYRDATHSGAAIYWYRVVYDAPAWSEERYIAALNLGRLTGEQEWFAKAAAINPRRAEAWRALGCGVAADFCAPDPSFLFAETTSYALR